MTAPRSIDAIVALLIPSPPEKNFDAIFSWLSAAGLGSGLTKDMASLGNAAEAYAYGGGGGGGGDPGGK
jgi:hypothetical protein